VALTQARLRAVIEESLAAHSAHIALRRDLYAALDSNVPNERKLNVIADLLERTEVPNFLPRAHAERAHILRTRERNQRAAQRMRKVRSTQKGEN
jgi:hypothetical protein